MPGHPTLLVILPMRKLGLSNAMPEIIEKIQTDLLDVIQTDFPIEERPFKAIGNRIGLTEKDVLNALQSLKDKKILRRLGPVFELRKLGYVSTLVAVEVNKEQVSALSDAIQKINEITHNYLRDHTLNMWFTITARNKEVRDDIITWVRGYPGVIRILDLPVVSVFKINAVFGVKSKSNVHISTENNFHNKPLTSFEQDIVRALQEDFPLVERPFRAIAGALNNDESDIIKHVQQWLSDRTIRRFGARLNHRLAGYTCNLLAAWKGPHLESLGKIFAEFPEITHCYLRKSHTDWPYELFTMIHAKSEKEMSDSIVKMKNFAQGAEIVTLKTLKELKKTSMKYFLEDEKWNSPS